MPHGAFFFYTLAIFVCTKFRLYRTGFTGNQLQRINQVPAKINEYLYFWHELCREAIKIKDLFETKGDV